jgi:hypothetical protein
MQIFTTNDLFSGGGIDPDAPLGARVARGIKGGLLGAVALTLFALLIVAIARPERDDLPAPLAAFVALYFGGGLFAGAAYGALRPLLRTLLGTFVFLFCLLALLLVLLFLTVSIAEGDSFSAGLSRWLTELAAGAAILALVFTPTFWGRNTDARWAGPAFVAIMLAALAIKGTGNYLASHPDVTFWTALLHQWPVLVPAGFIGLFELLSRRGRSRAV